MAIDHKMISMAIHLPSADSRSVVVSDKQKYVHKVLVNCFVKLTQEKSVARCRDFPRPDLRPNNGPFPIQKEGVVLQFGENFMIKRSKIPNLQIHENLHKNVIFNHIFMQIFMNFKATNMLQLYTANFYYGF